MRKNYFKAKVINSQSYPEMIGQWYDGYYTQDLDQGIIKHYIYNCPTSFEIDPETLCQFTGLYDKKGYMIYENDLLKKGTHNMKGQFQQIVLWLEAGARFVQYPLIVRDGNYYNNHLDSADFHEGLTKAKAGKLQVIGSAFDNNIQIPKQ